MIGTDLQSAKRYLEAGNVVGIPTETVYGLAGNALNPDAVLTIFRVKNRPAFDPLIVHTDSLDKVRSLVTELPPLAEALAEAFWPGPLTLLLPKQPHVPDLTTSGLPRVAVRIPNHSLTISLLQQLDFPLAAPSANPFGYISPTTAWHVEQQLGDQVPYILDGGPCGVGLESTIVGFDTDGEPTVYRLGGLALEALEAVVGRSFRVQSHSASNPSAPGMLSSHYAPRKPTALLNDAAGYVASPTAGALVFNDYLPNIPTEQQLRLSPTGDLNEAAKNLFSYLRQLDAMPVERIYIQPVPDEGLGRAINDRLRRAAA
ncbi:Sua5/YciO/YrdC/YwlC family protein [Fibrella aestuarina BUZ 2]|uniref:Threonylcarbamoyl-AMP synthase n=1 Tax=Fibrella aestuarina BUZ 2 TaxID=1166018 RepID=I0KDC5_9BACT|nr:L-threonylcarbamoyladenylate synthase [Fibrella aestuarina]CCH02128.1 Sua5/YciO/YrdC/YwlC family protein [Fibrella aestuarina BUZ 2]